MRLFPLRGGGVTLTSCSKGDTGVEQVPGGGAFPGPGVQGP